MHDAVPGLLRRVATRVKERDVLRDALHPGRRARGLAPGRFALGEGEAIDVLDAVGGGRPGGRFQSREGPHVREGHGLAGQRSPRVYAAL